MDDELMYSKSQMIINRITPFEEFNYLLKRLHTTSLKLQNPIIVTKVLVQQII